MATWPGTFYSEPSGERSGGGALACGIGPLTGTVRIDFKKGHVKSIAWEVLPDSKDVAQALQAAVRRADSLGYFLGLKSPPGSPNGTVRLGLTTTAADVPAHGLAVLRVRMPYIRIETPAGVRHQPVPAYPRVAAQLGVAGDVTLQYVIDEDGRVQAASIRVLEANYQEFVDAAVTTIVASEYTPARVGACPVKSRVEQRIRFLVQ
jgi:TonB family protein